MNIIKLSAINSTNEYLRKLVQEQHVENYTLVTAEAQTGGRGQMGASWIAEAGKNLTFSVLVKDLLTNVQNIFYLNAATSVSIAQAMDTLKLSDICIKWPNDILAGNKKIAGILIENSIRSSGEIYSVIGIGLNVNQADFEGLPKASSMAVAAGHNFDKEEVMLLVAQNLKRNISRLMHGGGSEIWDAYISRLYKKGVPMPFEKDGERFMGIIQGVSNTGCLQVLTENEQLAEYTIKEVQLLY